MMHKVSLLGLGLMGAPMARRLLGAGDIQLTVWNRTADKCRMAVASGAAMASSPEDALAAADLIILMLTDGPAVEDLLFTRGGARAIRPGAIVVDMGSHAPSTARDMAQRLNQQNVSYLDAPVSGGTAGASAGTLAIMAGGDQAVFDEISPVLRHLGRPTRVGPVGAGQIAKLANQMIVGITINAVAEAFLLAENAGADIAKIREALSGGFADSTILQAHGSRMIERNWAPGAPIRLQLKDLNNALSLASDVGIELPVTAIAAKIYAAAISSGFGEYDHSAAMLELEQRAANASGQRRQK